MPQKKNINFWFCYWASYVSFCSYVTSHKEKNQFWLDNIKESLFSVELHRQPFKIISTILHVSKWNSLPFWKFHHVPLCSQWIPRLTALVPLFAISASRPHPSCCPTRSSRGTWDLVTSQLQKLI